MELVDSKVRQAMTRMAEVFAEDVTDEERFGPSTLVGPTAAIRTTLPSRGGSAPIRNGRNRSAVEQRLRKEFTANEGPVFRWRHPAPTRRQSGS